MPGRPQKQSALLEFAFDMGGGARDVRQLFAAAQALERDELPFLHPDGPARIGLSFGGLEHDYAAFVTKHRVSRLNSLTAHTDRDVDGTFRAKNLRGDRRRSA